MPRFDRYIGIEPAADAGDLKSPLFGRVGSIPSPGTRRKPGASGSRVHVGRT